MSKPLLSMAALALCFMISKPSLASSINTPRVTTPNETNARGVLRAGETVEITANINERLLEAPYKLGDYFKSGALLVKFDCALQEAELAAHMKTHQTRRIKYETASELFQYGAGGRLDVSLAESEMQQALAEADVIQTRLKNCSVYAPFSGYVTAHHVSAFETPQRGQALYSLERARSSELSIIAPSAWVKWIKKGQKFEFIVDATEEKFTAKIVRIGVSVDPVSQTFEIIAKPERPPKALTGMSGIARFKDVP